MSKMWYGVDNYGFPVEDNSRERRKKKREAERAEAERAAEKERLSAAAKKGVETRRAKAAEQERKRFQEKEKELRERLLYSQTQLARAQSKVASLEREQTRFAYEKQRVREEAKTEVRLQERKRAENNVLRKEQAKERRIRREAVQEYLKLPGSVRSSLPSFVDEVVREIVAESSMRDGVAEMMGREREFKTPTAALLAGIAALPESARHFDQRMDEHWAQPKFVSGDESFEEVIIGAGLHAAIYCSVRAAMGKPKPLVLEARPRAGGAFAVSKGPSFYLNSRNRPGELSIPGQEGALNVLPAAAIQPSDLDGNEYPTNNMLAWAIRASLAMSAIVQTSMKVFEVTTIGNRYKVSREDGQRVYADRVILASGLSVRKSLYDALDPRVLSFDDLMARMDQPFPLKGMRRVAVLGGGDSGKTAIEALTGQGPKTNYSPSSVDWVERIDWYGAKQFNRGDWEACNRSRYKGIGRLLPKLDGDGYPLPSPFRVSPQVRATSVTPGYECVYVDERPYDCVIDCTGFDATRIPLTLGNAKGVPDGEPRRINGRECYRSYYREFERCYVVGPAAQIPLSPLETAALGDSARVPENTTSMFRYAPRTAALAASFT